MKSKPNPGKLLLAVVKDALYDWVKKELNGRVVGTSILWRDQSQALPTRPCVAMKITAGPLRTGFQDNLGINSAGRSMVGGQRTLVVSVQLFGNSRTQERADVSQMAVDLNSSLSKPAVLGKLRSAGVAVYNQGEVSNLTEVEETEFEERYEFSVMLGVAENLLDDPGFFEELGAITSELND